MTEQATVPKVAVADPAMFDLGLFGGLDDDELAAAREEMKRGCGWG